MKKLLLSPWLALITLAAMITIRVFDHSFVESMRLRYFDQLITSKPVVTSQQVHVVNIDDETIRQKGQFPFPRGEYASLIDSLYRNGAGLVVFNVFMPDADRFNQDNKLGNILKKVPVILPHVATNNTASKRGYEPFKPGVSVIGDGDPGISYNNIQPNVEVLNETAAGIGVVNTVPEIDGVVRRIPMVVNVQSELYPSVTLETLRVASGDPSFQVKTIDGAIQAVRIPKFGKIPTDSYGRIWVDWSSRPTEHSAANLPKNLENAIVIVGLTGRGLNNPVATSAGEVYPHYLQASILSTIVNGINISRPDWADGVEIISIAVAGIALLLFTRWVYIGLAAVLGFIVAGVASSLYLFNTSMLLLDPTLYVASLIVLSLHAYGIKFVSEYLQKVQIKKQFGTYLSPAMVEKLQKNPELLRLGGEARELSIMFTDVRGFTTISEHYGQDVQGLTKIMNRYMTAMTERIINNEGTLDKYIGDAQMAFWNAPLDDAYHAKNAVRTGLAMLGDLDAFNEEIAREGVPAFGMGIGINTATVVVGNMGSRQRFDYTCLGDGVNLASRLEGQSKPYGVKMVIGAKTADQVKDEYPVFELDCIAVKGKKEGVLIYTIAQETEQHRHFLEHYYRGNWSKALKLLPLCKNVSPEMTGYYSAMEERLIQGKPSDWDGTFRATSK